MKGAFLADAAFKEVDKVLLEMYLVTRDSGKVTFKIYCNATQCYVCGIC